MIIQAFEVLGNMKYLRHIKMNLVATNEQREIFEKRLRVSCPQFIFTFKE
jgi:hypothetical protein